MNNKKEPSTEQIMKRLQEQIKQVKRKQEQENKNNYEQQRRQQERDKDRVRWETYEYLRTRNLILTEIYTILNLSKARGRLILKAFLRGGLQEEEMETIAGETSSGEIKKRGMIDRLLGRNKPKMIPPNGGIA